MIAFIGKCIAAFASFIGRGHYNSKDYERAHRWLRFAAEWNDLDAQICMSGMCSLGEGTPKDASEAAKWCRRAAENGHVFSQYMLGMMLYRGIGLDADPSQAVSWFTRAIDSGRLSAEHHEMAIGLRALALIEGRNNPTP